MYFVASLCLYPTNAYLYLHFLKRVPQILRIKRLYISVSYGSEKERKLLVQTLTVYLTITYKH